MAGTFLDNLTIEDITALFPQNVHRRITAYWPLIAANLKERHLTSREAVLYVIGTIEAETRPTFSPAAEVESKDSRNIDKAGYAGIQDPGSVRPFGEYDSSFHVNKKGKLIVDHQLGNAHYRGKDDELMRARHGDPAIPDLNEGEKYRGRGFVQITGKWNYWDFQRKVGRELGIDLVKEPEKAEDPETAARIIAFYLSRHRSTIEKEMKAGHYKAARHVVNKDEKRWHVIERVVSAYDAHQKKKAEKAEKAAAARVMGPPRPSPVTPHVRP